MSATSFAITKIHQRKLYQAAIGFLGDREEARDAVQDAILKAVRAEASYDSSRALYPWLYVILRNTCRDILGRSGRNASGDVDVERFSDAQVPVDQMLEAAEARRTIWVGMRKLSTEHREIINMKHFQDLSYLEIGEILGLAEGTVMSRLFRARRALAKAMKEAK